eukprot:TRINITY_DN30213_c0_g1_i2.p1 TRINITY_DN30213_c0_g1~~TRINITY_DN30213_c0_g1_i2.p1  ORF type:complete len:612 (-),score=129.57 TRINITY_DN30213_c0_g1_i2:250-2085(-)
MSVFTGMDAFKEAGAAKSGKDRSGRQKKNFFKKGAGEELRKPPELDLLGDDPDPKFQDPSYFKRASRRFALTVAEVLRMKRSASQPVVGRIYQGWNDDRPDVSVAQYCKAYGVDSWTEAEILALPVEKQKQILNEGPVGGPTASLDVMMRIRQVRGLLTATRRPVPSAPPAGGEDPLAAAPGSKRLPIGSDLASSQSSHGFKAMEELHNAATWNDGARLRFMLGSVDLDGDGVRLQADLRNEHGETPAFVAASMGNAEACAVLLDHGADPLARDNHPNIFGDGIWPNERRPDKDGQAPYVLNLAKMKREKETTALPGKTVVYMMRLKGILDDVLARCVPNTRARFLQILADGLMTFHGKPALVVAAAEDRAELAALFLTSSCGLDLSGEMVQLPGSPVNVNMPDERRQSNTIPWGRRMSPPPPGVVMPMKSHQQQQSSQSMTEMPPSSDPVLSVFLQRGPALLVACTNKSWRTALVMLAAGVPRIGINSSYDQLGRTSLHVAASSGEATIVSALLQASASTSVISHNGRMALHEACAGGHEHVVDLLVKAGSDTRAKVNAPKRPWGTIGYINGATMPELSRPPGRLNDIGRTPYEVAIARGHDRCAALCTS